MLANFYRHITLFNMTPSYMEHGKRIANAWALLHGQAMSSSMRETNEIISVRSTKIMYNLQYAVDNCTSGSYLPLANQHLLPRVGTFTRQMWLSLTPKNASSRRNSIYILLAWLETNVWHAGMRQLTANGTNCDNVMIAFLIQQRAINKRPMIICKSPQTLWTNLKISPSEKSDKYIHLLCSILFGDVEAIKWVLTNETEKRLKFFENNRSGATNCIACAFGFIFTRFNEGTQDERTRIRIKFIALLWNEKAKDVTVSSVEQSTRMFLPFLNATHGSHMRSRTQSKRIRWRIVIFIIVMIIKTENKWI